MEEIKIEQKEIKTESKKPRILLFTGNGARGLGIPKLVELFKDDCELIKMDEITEELNNFDIVKSITTFIFFLKIF